MRGPIQELSQVTELNDGSTFAHSTIFKDYLDCFELANAPLMYPCNHHVGFMYYHFSSENDNISMP